MALLSSHVESQVTHLQVQDAIDLVLYLPLPTNMNDVKIFYILVQANNGFYKVLHVDAVPFTNSLIALRDSIHERLQVLGTDGEKKSMGFGHLQGSSGTYYY